MGAWNTAKVGEGCFVDTYQQAQAAAAAPSTSCIVGAAAAGLLLACAVLSQ
jgi:hypothetical protein